MQKFKVLVVGTEPDMAVKFHLSLLRTLVSDGHEVNIALLPCTTTFGPGAKLLEAGIRLHALPLDRNGVNIFAEARTIFSFYRLCANIKPDVALFYTIKPVVYGLPMAWLAGVPRRVALIVGLGYAFTQGLELRRRIIGLVARNFYRFSLTFARSVVFQNSEDRQLMVDRKILPHRKTHVVDGCGVDTAYFSPPARDHVAFRFLMISRLVADKGVREFVEAARICRLKNPKLEFRLVGGLDSNPTSITKSELESWLNEGIISYGGYIDDVRDELKQCSAFVLPSYREGLPQSTIEAMATGLPIITTDAPGAKVPVTDGLNGFLVRPRDSQHLASACLAMANDPQLAATMGRESRHLALTRFSSSVVNPRLISIIVNQKAG
jgi:glycosyltransferase involved in cell wall biosynthesis